MTHLYALLAAQATGGASSGSLFGDYNLIFFFVIVFVAMYFIIIRPQRDEQKKREAAISALAKGDKVITAGGIHGTIVDTSAKDTVMIEIDKGVRVKINRASISVVPSAEPKAADAKPATETAKAAAGARK